VKSSEVANFEYNAAISRGDGAYLLEQEKPDIFRAKVGNIPPGVEVLITIKYVAEMKDELDKMRFLVPTYIAPRYGFLKFVSNLGSGVGPYKFSINVNCVSVHGIASIESPSHEISIQQAGNITSIGLKQGEEYLEKDFLLIFGYSNPHEPKIILESNFY